MSTSRFRAARVWRRDEIDDLAHRPEGLPLRAVPLDQRALVRALIDAGRVVVDRETLTIRGANHA